VCDNINTPDHTGIKTDKSLFLLSMRYHQTRPYTFTMFEVGVVLHVDRIHFPQMLL